MSASVVYAVTEKHVCWLSQIAHEGTTDYYRGVGRFLTAVCPEVWPEMRLRMEEIPSELVDGEPRVRLTALWVFALLYGFQAPDDDDWTTRQTERWAPSEEAAKTEEMALHKAGNFRWHSVERSGTA